MPACGGFVAITRPIVQSDRSERPARITFDPMITVFTPSFADEGNTNAQNLTVKEIVSRLPPDEFHVRMLKVGQPDPRIASRENTELIQYSRHGNTLRLLNELRKHPPDIYFFPRYGPLDVAFLWLRRNFRLKSKLITYVVSAQDQQEVQPRLARAILDADEVVGNSVYVSLTVSQRFAGSVKTIHDGTSRDIFFPPRVLPRSSSGRLRVLYGGSFQPYKRVSLVIAEAAQRPEVEFRLAGTGVEENNCRRMADRLGCGNTTFLGQLTQAELGEEMRRADVMFFPSIVEGHPQVLGQAAACGLPVVAMDNYRPDYVVNGKTGFLVASDEELSEKLGTLLERIDLRCEFSIAAAKHALLFDWDKITQEWVDLFRGVMRTTGAGVHSER
jgi:glycosyltransferase involved in cell wall biosynthesis